MGKFFMGIAIGILSALVAPAAALSPFPLMVWCNVKMQNAVATSAAGFPIALFRHYRLHHQRLERVGSASLAD